MQSLCPIKFPFVFFKKFTHKVPISKASQHHDILASIICMYLAVTSLSHTLCHLLVQSKIFTFFWRTIPASTHHSLPVSSFVFLCLQQNWVTTSLVDCQLRHPKFCFVLRQFVTTCKVTSWPPPLVRVAVWSPPEFGQLTVKDI